MILGAIKVNWICLILEPKYGDNPFAIKESEQREWHAFTPNIEQVFANKAEYWQLLLLTQ